MGQLVNDAKELVMRLKEREKNVDHVVVQSNALAKKVDAIQQLETELTNINEKANHRSKVAVLSSIQKENKVIKLLQQENEDLKESLEEHQSVLEIIMSKYRQQMLQLIRLKKQQELSEDYYQSAIFKNLQDKTDQIAEMTQIMKHAIDVDEQTVNETEERLQSLLVENRGLKEILKIKSKYGAHEQPMNNLKNNQMHDTSKLNLVHKDVQTEPLLVVSHSNDMVEDKLEISKLMDSLILNTANETEVHVQMLENTDNDILKVEEDNSLSISPIVVDFDESPKEELKTTSDIVTENNIEHGGEVDSAKEMNQFNYPVDKTNHIKDSDLETHGDLIIKTGGETFPASPEVVESSA